MGIFNALKKVGAAIRGSSSSGSPANTPTAISSLDNPAPGDPELQARLQSAKIIETLVEIFGTPQENNRLEISEDRSPSSKFDNVLKTSNLLATQSEFIDSVITPIGGLYGIVLKSAPGAISLDNVQSTSLRQNLTDVGNSAWGLLVSAANVSSTTEALNEDEPTLSLDVLKFPEYYVFVFSNISPQTPIPLLSERQDILEYDSITAYPKAVVTNKNLRQDLLQPGTMIRVEYDGIDNKSKPVIVEVVEDKPEFTRMVMNSMKNRSAILSDIRCSTDSALQGVTHPTGDALGTSEQQ